MTEKSSSKLRSHHIIENHGHMAEVTKEPMADFKYIQTHAEINTEQIPRVQDIGTNTSENNEQINATVNNDNVPKETVEILLTAIEMSESHWKMMTEQRQQAIQETNIENEQLHTLIDDLNKENEKLRVVANHCDYLQKILDLLIDENDNRLADNKYN